MNFINLPKDLKNIISSFLFDYDRHQIKKTKLVLAVHTIKDKHYWYAHRGKTMLRFLYANLLNPKTMLSNETNELYIKNYQDKIDKLEFNESVKEIQTLRKRRQLTKDNKIAKKERRNKKLWKNKILLSIDNANIQTKHKEK
jgi:hypothetical protein